MILFGHTTLREINHFYCRHLAQQIDCITKSGGSRLGIYHIENTLHITHVIYVQPVWPNATNAIRFVDSANEPWIFRFIIISTDMIILAQMQKEYVEAILKKYFLIYHSYIISQTFPTFPRFVNRYTQCSNIFSLAASPKKHLVKHISHVSPAACNPL